MRDFARKRWSPVGSRPHVLIPVYGSDVAALASHYSYDHDLGEWYSEWDELLRGVHPFFWHLTLAWLDTPTARTEPGNWLALRKALLPALANVGPVVLTAGTAVVSEHGVHLRVNRTPELDQLADAAREAMHSVFGAAAPVSDHGPDWQPHIALFHGRADVKTPSGPLRVTHLAATMPVREVLLVDHDTWGPDGPRWDIASARRVPVGDTGRFEPFDRTDDGFSQLHEMGLDLLAERAPHLFR